MTYIVKSIRLFGVGLLIVLAGVLSVSFATPAGTDGWGRPPGEYRDLRHHHDRFYPQRGGFVAVLPPDYRMFMHHGSRFYFSGGIWYLADGGRFLVVAPPLGLVVPYLPPYYTTVWVAGVPYYYANEVYYVQAPGGYTVVTPPQANTGNAAPPANEQLFIYPRNGQGEQQQANDRYECHRWASSQTGYDPTQPPAGLSGSQLSQKRSDYRRAISACLDGRGYTVK